MANTETKKSKPKKKAEEKVLIIIPKPKNVIGDEETIVSVNGEMYQIQYDVPVYVPRSVAEVVESSKLLQKKIDKETQAAILKPGKQSIAEL